MIAAFAPWQALLNGLGAVLAWIYDLIPNYGVSIIVLTVLIRVILLPLGIKQIKSMQSMQAIQPKVKELQKKYKGNKQKQQEETMKLYREAGVNPLGGCLPLLLQFPILIAMYSILRAPLPNAGYDPVGNPEVLAYVNNHLPLESELYHDVTTGQNQGFLFMNLQCTLVQAGDQAQILNSKRQPSGQFHDCGDSRFPDVVPYVVLLALMVGSTLVTQRQMQKASPPGANQQQQLLLKIMPVMFGFFGLQFPAGLVLYWTVSNLIQMAQQTFLLRAGHIGPQAMERRLAESKAKAASQPARSGFMSRLMERAEGAQKKREEQVVRRSNPSGRKRPQSGKRPQTGKRQPQKGAQKDDGSSSGARPRPKRPRRGPGSGA